MLLLVKLLTLDDLLATFLKRNIVARSRNRRLLARRNCYVAVNASLTVRVESLQVRIVLLGL